jgi:hypothetical protein
MKAYEFPGRIAQDGNIPLPEAVRSELRAEQVVRVILLVDEPEPSEDEAAWAELSARQFFEGYAQEDAVYDDL